MSMSPYFLVSFGILRYVVPDSKVNSQGSALLLIFFNANVDLLPPKLSVDRQDPYHSD